MLFHDVISASLLESIIVYDNTIRLLRSSRWCFLAFGPPWFGFFLFRFRFRKEGSRVQYSRGSTQERNALLVLLYCTVRVYCTALPYCTHDWSAQRSPTHSYPHQGELCKFHPPSLERPLISKPFVYLGRLIEGLSLG